jgi:DNA-binding transcriptional ArsR family regulator
MAKTRKRGLGRHRVAARVFKALGHPARLLMVDELSRGKRCVCELKALVGFEMPTVSRHLAVLREAGVVEDEKRGQKVFYKLKTPCVARLFACVAQVCGGSLRD